MDWKRIRADIAKGLREGVDTIRDGAGVVVKKAGEMSEEGQKKVRIFNIKRRIQGLMEDLGALVYELEKTKPGSIMDPSVKAVLGKIEQANSELLVLETKTTDGNPEEDTPSTVGE